MSTTGQAVTPVATPASAGDDNPFEGTANVVPATSITSDERLKIAIVGESKTGKSWMAATAPGPIMFYDFDDRAASLRGKPNLGVKTLLDLDQFQPRAVKTLDADLNNFKYRKKNGKAIPATFVFDSMTYFKKAIENEYMDQMKGGFRELKVSALTKVRIPEGWDVINGVRSYLEYTMTEFSTLGNIICVFHVRDEKDKDKSTPKETKYTGKLTVDPQYLATLLSLFNEVYYISVDAVGKYEVVVKPNYECRASTTLLLDDREPPNINTIIAKHRANLAKAKT